MNDKLIKAVKLSYGGTGKTFLRSLTLPSIYPTVDEQLIMRLNYNIQPTYNIPKKSAMVKVLLEYEYWKHSMERCKFKQ